MPSTKSISEIFPDTEVADQQTRNLIDPSLFLQYTDTNGTRIKSIRFTNFSLKAEINQGESRSLLEYLVTSDSAPVSVQLSAADTAGNVPTWLRVNKKLLKNIAYTTGSEISFDINSIGLAAGKHTAKIIALRAGYKAAVLNVELTVN